MNKLSLLSLLNDLSGLRVDAALKAKDSLKATMLLNILSSGKELQFWAKHHQISESELYNMCVNFLVQHIKSNVNNSYRLLFVSSITEASSDTDFRKNYLLLMNIFHPDKRLNVGVVHTPDYEKCTSLLIFAYQDLKKKVRVGNSNDALGGRKRKKIKLKKVQKAQRKPHPHLLLSLFFIGIALLLITYMSLDKELNTDFHNSNSPPNFLSGEVAPKSFNMVADKQTKQPSVEMINYSVTTK